MFDHLPPDDPRPQGVLVPAIPWDAGSLDPARVRDLIASAPVVFSQVDPVNEAERQIAQIVHEALPEHRPSMTDDLLVLGGDSMTAVALTETFADRFGVEIEPADLFTVGSLRAVARMVFPDQAS